MIRYDEASQALVLAVQDLLSAPLSPVSRDRSSGALRRAAGARVHAAARSDEADNQVQTEVPVAWELPYRGFQVRIEGRVDRIRRRTDADEAEVEEIKSRLDPGTDPADWQLDPAHAEQALFYALLLHRTGTPVRACRVIWIDAVSGASRPFDLPFEPDEVDRLIRERLDVRIDTIVSETEARKQRRALAERLAFPHATPRPPQRILVQDIASAAAAGGTMMLSAPTGIGKTAAALYPVVRRALETDGVVLFLTSRISQQELALRTLAAMLPRRGGALAVQITAKERSCPFDEWQCVEGRCPHIDRFDLRLRDSGLEARLLRSPVLTGAAITRAAVNAGLCPFETTLALARQAVVLVADYNYVFHPGVALKSLLDNRDRPLYLIVDEAHNLPDRVADFYSPRLDLAAMDRIATLCLAQNSGALRETGICLDAIVRHHRAAWTAIREELGERPCYTGELDRHFFETVQDRLEDLLVDCFLALAGRPSPFPRAPRSPENSGRLSPDPLLEILFTLRTFCLCAAADPLLFATLVEPHGLRLFCLNPAVFVRQTASRFTFVLAMSATLTPFSYYARMLGVEEDRAVTLELPSPFPRENRLLLAVSSVDTSFKARHRDADAIADLIIRTVSLRTGNYLVFFPSFAFRDLVVSRFPPGAYRCLLQTPAMRTEAVLRQLRNNRDETLLLCGVQGGVFAEGVDYPGHLAIGAFVVGPGLPMVSPERKLLEAYYETLDGTGKGFDLAYVTPGVVRAVQAGGRVIRSETDRGFVMLIGRRFGYKLYRSKLPEFWSQELVEPDDPVACVSAFWNGAAP